MESSLYLGVITFVGQRGPLPVASLRPLFIADEGEREWELELSEEARRQQFPNVGYVSWLHPVPEAVEGSLWEFRVRDQPSYQAHDLRHDRLMVAEHSYRQVFRVIDLRAKAVGSCDVRDLLTNQGISIARSQCPKFWILCEKNSWMLAEFSPKSDREDLSVVHVDGSGITRWQEWELTRKLYALNGENDVWLLPPGITPAGTPQQRDWAPDIVVLERVLKYVRKYDRKFFDAIEASNQIVERFSELLSAQPLNEPGLHRGRFERARDILGRLQDSGNMAEAIMIALSDSPIADELEDRKKSFLEEERKTAMEKAQESLGALGKEIESRKDELQELDTQLAEKRQEQASLATSLENAIAEKVRGVMNDPIELLSTVALVRAVMGVSDFNNIDCHINDERFAPPRIESLECKRITVQEEAFRAVQKRMILSDVSSHAAGMLHATFLAGAVPLVVGARAYDALVAYSHVITGGRIHWIPVSSSWVQPSDCLFARQSGSDRTFTLMDYLCKAREDRGMHLVIIDGLERSIPESFLIPLLGCYQESMLGIEEAASSLRARAQSVLGNGTAWPQNVLLATVSSITEPALQLPNCLWQFSGLCLIDLFPIGPEFELNRDKHPRRRFMEIMSQSSQVVDLAIWKQWRNNCTEVQLETGAAKWTEVSAKLSGNRAVRDLFLSLFAAARQFGDEDNAIAIATACALLPHLAYDSELALSALSELKVQYPDSEETLKYLRLMTGHD